MPYQHKIDKALIPKCRILDVEIAAINMNWLIKFTEENIERLSGDYMCVSNVHTTVMAFENQNYSTVQNGGVMAIPDGAPLSFVGRRRGYEKMERTTGPDYLNEILKISREKGYKHYFYGSTQETLNKLKSVVDEKYPGVQIVGMYSPPFRKLTEDENLKIIAAINAANPDYIWVGLGAPKQEVWMSDHQGKIKGFMVGVGAAFDYLAGNIKRAPQWMQKGNLEWLYRLIQDPRRLFMRYLITNIKFIWHTLVKDNV